MRVGVPRESWPGEHRVALTPTAVAALKKTGLEVVVERDAGTAAGFTSTAYETSGAAIADRDGVFASADILLQVRSIPAEPARLRRGQAVIGFADPLGSPDAIRALAHAGDVFKLGEQGGWAIELQGLFLFGALAVMLLGGGRFSVGGLRGRLN